jgi:hypothetical protein
MKQTAVEWLKQNLPSLFLEDSKHYAELFEQAKEMEKQQIIDAYLQKRRLSNISKSMKLCVDAETYYNETYKKP